VTTNGYQISAGVRSGYPNIAALRDSMGITAYHDLLRESSSYPTVCALADDYAIGCTSEGTFWPGDSMDYVWPRLTVFDDGTFDVLSVRRLATPWIGMARLVNAHGHLLSTGIPEVTSSEILDTLTFPSHDMVRSRLTSRVVIGWTRPPYAYRDPRYDLSGNDVYIVDSDDRGETWNSPRNITQFVPGDTVCFAETGDTVVCNRDTLRAADDMSLLFDADDALHAAFTTEGYYSFTAEGVPQHWVYALIWHWSEATGQYGLIGSGWYYNWNVSARDFGDRTVLKPSLSIDTTNGDLYCAYMKFDSSYVSEAGYWLADIWVSVSTDGGAHWSTGTNVTRGRRTGSPCHLDCEHFRDPCLSELASGGVLHLAYLKDFEAGSAGGGLTDATSNPFTYQRIPVDSIPTTPLMPQYPLHWDSTGFYAAAQDRSHPVPRQFTLSPPFPNPFNSSSTIAYSLSARAKVHVAIYDLLGREVAVLVNGMNSAGAHSITWDASGHASGLYFVALRSGTQSQVRKLVLLK
jgi:hypothetical protein